MRVRPILTIAALLGAMTVLSGQGGSAGCATLSSANVQQDIALACDSLDAAYSVALGVMDAKNANRTIRTQADAVYAGAKRFCASPPTDAASAKRTILAAAAQIAAIEARLLGS